MSIPRPFKLHRKPTVDDLIGTGKPWATIGAWYPTGRSRFLWFLEMIDGRSCWWLHVYEYEQQLECSDGKTITISPCRKWSLLEHEK